MTRAEWGVALSAALAFVGLARGEPDEEDRKAAAAREAVVQVARNLDDPSLARRAKDAAKAHAAEDIFRVFKPRSKGGIGVGETGAPPGVKDGIELALIDMATRRNNPGQEALEKHNADLVRIAEVTLAVAEITYHYKLEVKSPRKDAEYWMKQTDEMKTAAKELLAAVRAKDQKRVTAAAKRLNASCIGCHRIGRFGDD